MSNTKELSLDNTEKDTSSKELSDDKTGEKVEKDERGEPNMEDAKDESMNEDEDIAPYSPTTGQKNEFPDQQHKAESTKDNDPPETPRDQGSEGKDETAKQDKDNDVASTEQEENSQEHKITDGNQTNMQEEERNEHNKSPTEEKRRENTEMEKDVLQNTLNKIEDESISLQLRIDMLNDSINSECTHLSSTPLKDYERLQYLKQIMSCSNNVCKKVEDTLVHMNSNMVRVNQSISEMKKAIDKKMSSEGLLTWAEQLKTDPSDPDAVAREKLILAQAAEAKSALAEATQSVPKAEQKAAELALQAAEAAALANKAQQEAENARIAAEQAKKAAEKKRKQELEAQKREEEEKRKREEQERKRREEEERRQMDLDNMGSTPEERERLRLEKERRDPKNWPVWVYSADPGSTGIAVGCVIRAMPDTVARDEITVERIDQLSEIFKLGKYEELVSNIIQINHSDENFKSLEPISIAIPQIAPRSTSRECVIKMLQPNGTWAEISSSDVSFEDMKEFKFVECRLHKLTTLAVVTRIKQEQHTVHKRGGKVAPSIDPRVCFTIRQSMFKVSTSVTVEVCPVDSSLVSDVRDRKPDCGGLVASSPIVRFQTPLRKFTKSVMVNIPLPVNPSKVKQRPSTATPSKTATNNSSNNRPKSAHAAVKTEEEDEDTVHLLTPDLENDGEWIVVDGIQLVQPKNKDIVTFEMAIPMAKFIILRTSKEVTISGIEKIARELDIAMEERVVQLVLRQKNDDENNVILQCTLASKIDETIRKLSEKGYDYGPNPSHNIITHEGQPLLITFRGNIECENADPIQIVYNSQIPTKAQFQVKVQDIFAQKSIDCYRGFTQVQLIAQSTVKQAFEEKNAQNDQQQNEHHHNLKKSTLVCEQLINISKPEIESQKVVVKRAPVEVKSDGLVDKDMLQQLASELGDEWKRLAQYLNVRKVRIQSILRNNADKDTEHAIYEMLLTWIKRVPKSANKVDILCSALVACGRVDQAEVMKDNERDFKRQKSRSARDSYLRKAFVKIAQSPHVVTDWKFLARQLEMKETELQQVDESFNGIREKCYHSLIKWRELFGEEATPDVLVRTLKKCKYIHVAEQVQELLKDAV